MQYNITLKQQSYPFASTPRFADLDPDTILLNDVIFPQEIDRDCGINPHNVRAWVVGNEHGALCMVWANCEQEALDAACDNGKMESVLAENQDYGDDSLTPLGNAGELHDLTYCWIAEVEWNPSNDIKLIVAIVRATEAGMNTLGDYR